MVGLVWRSCLLHSNVRAHTGFYIVMLADRFYFSRHVSVQHHCSEGLARPRIDKGKVKPGNFANSVVHLR